MHAFPLPQKSNLIPNFTTNLSLPRHGWFYFKEGFSSTLVSEVLSSTGRITGRALDPFLGSGTTALVAASNGWESYGIEVNPFLAFLAQVKTEPHYDHKHVLKLVDRVLVHRPKTVDFKLPDTTTLIERPNLERWLFNRSVAERYEQLLQSIKVIARGKYERLLKLALIASMHSVANARRDGKCWRYRRNWSSLAYHGEHLEQAFMNNACRYAADCADMQPLPMRPTIIKGDSRQTITLLQHEHPESFDALITSPPYLNSFDYTDIYRPELLLFGAADSSHDLKKLRLQTVRSHVQVAWPRPPVVANSLLARVKRTLRHHSLWDNRLLEMLDAYFADLSTVFSGCKIFLRRGAAVCIVVANSAYSGVIIPVDVIISQILESLGYEVLDTKVLRRGLGNGHHQRRSNGKLREVAIFAHA